LSSRRPTGRAGLLMSKKRIILVGVAMVILLAGDLWLPAFIARDKCLDSGGRWSAVSLTCER